jgi:hypothetical protein
VLYHQHQTQEAIAAQLGVDQTQISRDLAALRAEWKMQAATAIAEIKAEELAFYFAQRASVLAQWEQTHDPRDMALVCKWSERIALCYGLDAAVKQAIAITALRAEEITDEELAAIARGIPGASGTDITPAA